MNLKWFNYFILLSIFLFGFNYLLIFKLIKKIFTKTDFCVISNVFNPAFYESRYESYREFEKHMLEFDIRLITIELTFNNQQFMVTDSSNINHIQLRTNDTLWYKENLINIAVKRFSTECKYVAWIDLEVKFENLNWIEDTKVALETYKIVQIFDVVSILGPKNQVLEEQLGLGVCHARNIKAMRKRKLKKLVSKYDHSKLTKNYCTSGYGWVSKVETFLEFDGLFDKAIVGDGDNLVIHGMKGVLLDFYEDNKYFMYEYSKWSDNAYKCINGSIGYIKGKIDHLWHGSRKNRNYRDRRLIISKRRFNLFNPQEHLYYDQNGLLHFLPAYRNYFVKKISKYFLNRKEDSSKH